MFFVGFDYILNELMSDHITLVEPDYLNIVDILENLYGVDKTAALPSGRSIWVISPVTTIFELKPRRVKNIFICSTEVFCASSRIMKLSSSVRPRI